MSKDLQFYWYIVTEHDSYRGQIFDSAGRLVWQSPDLDDDWDRVYRVTGRALRRVKQGAKQDGRKRKKR